MIEPRELLVLSESTVGRPPSASLRELIACEEAARLQGLRVWTIPADFDRCGDAAGAVAHIPPHDEAVAIWNGYIPDADRYASIYKALAAKGVRLVNAPAEHRQAQELDLALPRLAELTPRSVVVRDESDCDRALAEVGLPAFIKGAVQSVKARGWSACVANTADELRELVRQTLRRTGRSRGRAIVRQLVPLRHARHTHLGFPMGREYRVFLLHGQIVSLGYYWDADDPLAPLTPDEEATVRTLATTAAARMGTPWIAVDVGQTTAGEWLVIETGDAQFSGLSCIDPLPHWHRLATRLT